ncbi:hypothetical protein UPYG_G00333580 [Umbra pygmaea]|uniref:Uncharacterized protein n=1 Tax=Umbra pygmaea TaxID=75934 RepID=A0ABD0VXI4_UMBPY
MKTTLVFLLLIFFGNIAVNQGQEPGNCCQARTCNQTCCINTFTSIASSIKVNLKDVLVVKQLCSKTSCINTLPTIASSNPSLIPSSLKDCCLMPICNISGSNADLASTICPYFKDACNGSTTCGLNLLLLALSAILSGLFLVL